jgi:hypothetical protein
MPKYYAEISKPLLNRLILGYSRQVCIPPLLELSMSTSLYDFSVPVFSLALTNMSHQLDKAAAYAERKKFDTKVLAEARLIADMLPLARQVQIACDNVKGPVARLAGIEAPSTKIPKRRLRN